MKTREARTFMVAALLTGSLLTAGCGSKKERDASTSAAGQSAAPTPAQEAAKQRAIEQGPAIQAANEAGKEGR